MSYRDGEPVLSQTSEFETAGWENLSVEEVYAQHYAELVGFVGRFTSSKDPEATVQEVFIKALRYKSAKENERLNKTWYLTVAKNQTIDEGRRPFNRNESPADPHERTSTDYADPRGQEDFDGIEFDDIADQIAGALDDKPHWKKALALRVLSGYSYDEISQELQIPLGTVRSALFRSAKLLSQHAGVRNAFGIDNVEQPINS